MAYSCRTNALILRKKQWRSSFFKKRFQNRCFPVEFVKLSRTVMVASEKNVSYHDLTKNYVKHKLAIFNAAVLLYCIYC